MSETKFTPGPWEAVSFNGNSLVVTELIVNEKEAIALLGTCGEKEQANAHLIAAAPDMYEALEAAVSEYGKPGGPWNVPSEPGTWIDKARAALAKARGEKIPQPVEEKQEELW